MEITGQTLSVRELIKNTSERFGNRGLSRFISGVQNSSEQQFRCTKEQAELLGTKDFVALKNVFGNDVMRMDMTPFKNISHEIKVYRESQSFFSRFCKGGILDKIQKQCTKIIAVNEDLNRSPVLLRDATLPDSAGYTTKDIMGKHRDLGFFVLYKSLSAGPLNLAHPDEFTQVKIQTSGTVELSPFQPVV